MPNFRAVQRRRGSLVLGASAVALASAGVSPAYAQCSPDPTASNVTCIGTDADGLVVTTNGSAVAVQAGAIVQGAAAPAIEVSIPVVDFYYSSRFTRIDIAGTVDGGNAAGILVASGPLDTAPYDYYSTDATIVVEAGGTVTGATGIVVAQSPGNSFGAAVARIDNAGDISGTGGVALAADGGRTDLQVVNRASGTIGAINGPLLWLDNAGTIDGGASSAIVGGATSTWSFYQPWTNSGTIRSASASATVQDLSPYDQFVNSGTIANAGTGAALVDGNIVLTNTTTGTIVSAGNVALEAAYQLRLVNDGRIEGDVLAGTAGTGGGSFVDSTRGVIDGDLIFGATSPDPFGDVVSHTLVARYAGAGTLITGVSGTIAGSGADELLLRVDADTTINSPIPLFAGFDRLQVQVENDATAVLGTNFTAPGLLRVSGSGVVMNQATLAADGQVLTDAPGGTLQIVNEGTIRTDVATPYVYAVVLDSAGLSNTGLIQAAGDGVSIYRGDFANSGEVIAGGTAVLTNGSSFSNDGTIRSSGGTGLYLTGSWAPQININRGVIEGEVHGVRLSRALVNTGTIRSGNLAVALDSYGEIHNRTGGVITGDIGGPSGSYGFNRVVVNAGTINGDVDLGNTFGLNTENRYFALGGGLLNGNLTLSAGDTLVAELPAGGSTGMAGINGTVNANGAHLRYQVENDATAVYAQPEGFGSVGYQLFDNAVLTLTGSGSSIIARPMQFAGVGTVDLTLDLTSADRTILQSTSLITPAYQQVQGGLDIVSRGTLTTTHRANDQYGTFAAVEVSGSRFTNAGTINVQELTVPPAMGSFTRSSAIRGGIVVNEGTINLAGATGVNAASSLVNRGTITQIAGTGAATGVELVQRVENSGTISVDGVAIANYTNYSVGPLTLTNTATGIIASTGGTAIRSGGGTVGNAGTITGTVDLGYAQQYDGTPARAYTAGSYIAAGGTVSGDVLFGLAQDVFVQMGETTGVSGVIDGGAGDDVFLHRVATSRTVSLDANPRIANFEWLALDVTDAAATATLAGKEVFTGDITARGAGTVVNTATVDGAFDTHGQYPINYLLSDIPTVLGTLDNRGTITGDIIGPIGTLVNSGTIGGQVWLGEAAHRIENRGTISGAVLMGRGDDTFVQHGGGTLAAGVDGGGGSDLFVMVADGAGTVSGDQLIRFERAMQVGTETVGWSGAFRLPTLELAGGTLAVASGQTFSTSGPVTITGGDAGVTVRNQGTITGTVMLGAGDDRYIEGAGSAVGMVDGGAGTNTYGVLLTGDRNGIGARANFTQLSVEGAGTLDLVLDQDFAAVSLAGSGLNGALNGHAIGRLTGSAAGEQAVLDGDVAFADLGGGGDLLSLETPTLAGAYAGGEGSDVLRVLASGPVTLTGSATGFEALALASDTLTVSGTLGASGDRLLFAGGSQTLTLATGGRLDGAVDLGVGDDRLRVAAGSTIAGTLSGGAGDNRAELDLAGGLSLAGSLVDFAQVTASGGGTLTIERGSSLLTPQLLLGAGGTRLAVAGVFAGAVTGTGGGDTILVTGGDMDRPVAFTDIAGIAAMQVDGGWATIAGTAGVGELTMNGGRLIGLPGSTLSAARFEIGRDATFGSAGIVNGDLAIAGTLSPGASPGTMVVNGNVALATGSTSLFEITPTASDLLTINGALTIADGATLRLVAGQQVTPGRSLDLITATGGITGRFATIIKPASIFGFVQQEDDRVTLLGLFVNDSAFAPTVSNAVDYVNDLLTAGLGSPALLAAAPLLVDMTGGTNGAAFARLTPQPYAAATQLVVEQGLDIARIVRGDAFAAISEEPGFFTFAAAIGRTGELAGDAGVARARTDSYGVTGGLGWGNQAFSVGAFIGVQDQRQDLAGLGARTDAEMLFGGIHARWDGSAVGVKGSITYADGDATTTRAVPAGRATGTYGLTGWTADLALDYEVQLGGDWSLRPGVGATVLRATRRRVSENGDPAFLLDVARDRYEAAFVDGSVSVMRQTPAGRGLQPWLSAGLRYRIDGDRPDAVAALSGGPVALSALGSARAALTVNGILGAEAIVSRNLAIFGSVNGEAGKETSQGGAQIGLRLAF